MYKLIVNRNWMGIVIVIVGDNTSKQRTASMCLNWNLTWQSSLDKESSAGYIIEYNGALEPQRKLQIMLPECGMKDAKQFRNDYKMTTFLQSTQA